MTRFCVVTSAAIATFCGFSAVAAATPLQECAPSSVPIVCLDAKLKAANQQLNAALKAAQQRIERLQKEGRRSVQGAFVDSQRKFNAYRDAQCAWQVVHAPPGASGTEYVKDCQIRATIAREQELTAFVRGEEDTILSQAAAPGGEPARTETAIAEAVSAPAAQAARQPSAPARHGIEWRLIKWVAKGEQRQLVPDSNVTIAFDPSGKVAGAAAINRFSGTYRFDADGRLQWPAGFSLTKMAGPPALMAQERAFLESLRSTVHYRVDGLQLVLENADASVVLTFTR